MTGRDLFLYHMFTAAQIAYLKLIFQSQLTAATAWASGSYAAGSLVTYLGKVWVAKGAPTIGTPGTDPQWALVVTEGGSPGLPTGTDGQVLTFNSTSGAWEGAAVPTELPSGSAGQVLMHTGSAWSAAYVGVPTGTVVAFAGATTPSGWLECDGADLLISSYTALATILGTTYERAGDPPATNYFTLPDLRGEFVRGWANARAVDTGRVRGSAQADGIKDHLHQIPVEFDAAGGGSNARIGGTAGYWDVSMKTNTNATETRPRNVAMMYIIKT